MNLKEYKGSFLFKSPSSSSHSFIYPNTGKLEMFSYSKSPIYSVSHYKFWSHRFLERIFDFFSPSGFDVQTNSDHKAQKKSSSTQSEL